MTFSSHCCNPSRILQIITFLLFTLHLLIHNSSAQLSRSGFTSPFYTYVGNGDAINESGNVNHNVSISSPVKLVSVPEVNALVFSSADGRAPSVLRVISSTGNLSTLAGLSAYSVNEFTYSSSDKKLYFSDSDAVIRSISTKIVGSTLSLLNGTIEHVCGLKGAAQGKNCSTSGFTSISDLHIEGGYLYVLENTRLSKIRLSNRSFQQVVTLNGDSKGRICKGENSDAANLLYVTRNFALQRFNSSSIEAGATVIAGTAGTQGSTDNADGSKALFNVPYGCDISSGQAYIADTDNTRMRVVNLTSPYAVSTFGTSIDAKFEQPQGVQINRKTLDMFISDTKSNSIRAICMCSPLGSTDTFCNMTTGYGKCTCRDGYFGARCQGSTSSAGSIGEASDSVLEEVASLAENSALSYSTRLSGLESLTSQVNGLQSSSNCATSSACLANVRSSMTLLSTQLYKSIKSAKASSRNPSTEFSILTTLTSKKDILDSAANTPLSQSFANLQCESSFALLDAQKSVEAASNIMDHAQRVQNGALQNSVNILTPGLVCLASKFGNQSTQGVATHISAGNIELYSLKQSDYGLAGHSVKFGKASVRLSAGLTNYLGSSTHTFHSIVTVPQLSSSQVNELELFIEDENGSMEVKNMSPPTEFSVDVSSFDAHHGVATGKHESGFKFVCKYYDESAKSWSTSGVTTSAFSSKEVSCSTTHFSKFAVFYEYSEVEKEDDKWYWVSLISIIGAFSLVAASFVVGLLVWTVWKEWKNARANDGTPKRVSV